MTTPESKTAKLLGRKQLGGNMSDIEAVRKVQAALNTLKPEELGAALNQANELRKHGPTDKARATGEILYRQILAAFTFKEIGR